MNSELGATPNGPKLVQDVRELEQSIREFHAALPGRPDPFRLRRLYSGIDASWHQLRAQLGQPGAATDAVLRAAGRVDAVDAQLHQTLALAAPPQGLYGASAAPTGLAETQRLALALEARAAGLVAAEKAGSAADPNTAAWAADAGRLARAVQTFREQIDLNQPIAAVARAFAPVDDIAGRVEKEVTAATVPKPVQDAWQAFAAVLVLIHENLGISAPQPTVTVRLAPAVAGEPSPLLALADRLMAETNVFVKVFGPNAHDVPDGLFVWSDAQRLQVAAESFRQDVLRGLPTNELAHRFLEVDVAWQRLVRRINRIVPGRSTLDMAQVQKLGVTCDQIHRTLGMPGYPAEVVLPAAAVPVAPAAVVPAAAPVVPETVVPVVPVPAP
jgi:hypothetical protein